MGFYGVSLNSIEEVALEQCAFNKGQLNQQSFAASEYINAKAYEASLK